MLPYLSELKGQFTRYKLEHIGNMTSIYAIRLYKLLMQWKTTGVREVEIEDIYPDMHNLKKRVIDPANKDINIHSNYPVSWTQRKTGRRVTHFIFSFAEKQPAKPKAAPN
jgi:plasmid replication initiation protein